MWSCELKIELEELYTPFLGLYVPAVLSLVCTNSCIVLNNTAFLAKTLPSYCLGGNFNAFLIFF